MEKVLAMHQSGFGVSASPNRGGAVHFGASQVPKITTHRSMRRQVLIPLDTPTVEVVMANATTAVESCNRGLVEAHSKLRVESVCKAWDGISMSTNFVASAAELEVIKQWLKKVAGLAASTVVEPRLPQSKSFLKILGTAMHPRVAQCRNCWRWGHPTHACCAQGTKCQKCGGPHRVENHRSMAWCCKANPKSNPPREATAAGALCPHTFKCLNCKGKHSAELCTGRASNSNIQRPRVGNF